MSLFAIIDRLGARIFAESIGVLRAYVWKIRHGGAGMSLRLLARIAGRYPDVDLRQTVQEMFPEEYARGQSLHELDDAPAEPHMESPSREVSP